MKTQRIFFAGISPLIASGLLTLALPALSVFGAGPLDDMVSREQAKFILAAAKADKSATTMVGGKPVNADAEHARLFVESKYPSAATCRTCHPNHYREWSVSAHAYAQLSPVFNTFEAAVTKLTQGSNGDFCIRCHTQVGMNLGESTFMSNMDRCPTSREGITCIVCHRLRNDYGKISGRFALVKGDILTPVYGPTGDAELKRVLSQPDVYRVVTNEVPGRKIHTDVVKFPALRTSGFCGTCHDVTLLNGFRLEEAFSNFKNSPAAHRGENCQDCHMGLIPGKKSGYAEEPAAIVGGVPTKPRRRTNHMFAGPDYSIINRGFFPHNDKAAALATIREWLTFNDKAGWGTDKFENSVPKDFKFPTRWASVDDRYDARAILNDQYALLAEIQKQRLQILRQGYQLGQFVVQEADSKGLKFKIQVHSGTDGHNVPTGFDAERVSYMQVFVTNSAGKLVFQSGDLDPNGDIRDRHSTYVSTGKLPLDPYLFSLQSPFLTSNVRGGDREQVLPINYSVDPLPFIRPTTFAVNFTGHPAGARVQRRGMEAFESRWPEYKVKASELTDPGPYTVHIRLLAGMVPINLISEIKVAGFDYFMSPREVAEAVKNGQSLLYDKEIKIQLDGAKPTINLADLADVSASTYVQK
ncbi:MAG TPA: multiheme c-type cytochrome [Verrucomicrobiae bacterium]|jgi:nitrate/TMAO reductase-like tetraheme cytochrome c subunit|nr:multiheme c-type cytochrome [Verrucomicrobiae bacterium]